MRIVNQLNGKSLRANSGSYLVNNTATSDEQKILAYEVYIPSFESLDQWDEIDEEEAQRIRRVKDAAKGHVEYPETEVNATISLMSTVINTVELTDDQALQFKSLYPTWESFIGKSLSKGFKVQYDDKLYKVLQDIDVVLENWYPSISTAALYTEVNPTVEEGGHAGTYEDPIPYNNNMQLELGKFYIQNEVIYECIRDTEIPVYNDLSSLVDNYVKVATKE